MSEDSPEVYRGRVIEVFSGDDLIAMIDLDVDGLYKRVRIRLEGVDTPNAIRAVADTSAGKVRSYVTNVTRNQDCSFEITSRTRNSWVARLTIHGKDRDFNLNDELIRQGYKFIEPAR